MNSFASLIRKCTDKKSLVEGKRVHGKIISSGSTPDVYTNNHLLAMYLKFNRVDCALNVFDNMPRRNGISWTTLVSSLSHTGLSEEALDYFRSMVLEGFSPNSYSYVAAISACADMGDVRVGKELHGRIFRGEEILNGFVTNSLVGFYGKCGLLKSARLVFDSMVEPDLVSWASVVSCCFQCKEDEEGLRLFLKSLRMEVKVNEFIFSSLLGACARLKRLDTGMQVHCLVAKTGVTVDQFVVTGLVNLYAKCDVLDAAWQAFLETEQPHLSAWTALIGSCVQTGKGRDAVELFYKLLSSGMKPTEETYTTVFGAIADRVDVQVGERLHCSITKLGFDSFTLVCNNILSFYMKRGRLDESLRLFREMEEHDVVTWNTVITGYAASGEFDEAIRYLRNMLHEGFDPSVYTYSSLLSICGDLPAVKWGKQTHCHALKPGFNSNVVVGSALIDMYAKCGQLDVARKVFDALPLKNLISWNIMLTGYAHNGFGKEALEVYNKMLENAIKPNDVTFVGVLSACGHVGLIQEGLSHFNSMIKNYNITPSTDHLACMVTLFARHGQTKEAFDFLRSFPGDHDKVVWRCLLSGCKSNKDVALGSYAAEKILSIDPDDTSAHIMLSNIYAELRMWDELADIRKLMKEKELKKDTGFSWTELQNKIVSFSANHNLHLEQNSVLEVLNGLTSQMFDEKYVPDITC